jgi:hypothetical protein
MVPFVWIVILKSIIKSTPGSYEIEIKESPEPFSKDDDVNRASTMGF